MECLERTVMATQLCIMLWETLILEVCTIHVHTHAHTHTHTPLAYYIYVGLYRSVTKEDMTKHRIQIAENLVRLCDKMSEEVKLYMHNVHRYIRNQLYCITHDYYTT